jgi:hypothetical protein
MIAAGLGLVLSGPVGGTLALLYLADSFLLAADASLLDSYLSSLVEPPPAPDGGSTGTTTQPQPSPGTPDGGTPDGGTGPVGSTEGEGSGEGEGDGDEDGDGDGGCFAAGTLIAMGDGGVLPIEAICEGDLVLSRSEDSRDTATRRVVRTWRHTARPTIKLRLSSGEIVSTTSVHRVFTSDRGVVSVDDLQDGEHLETLDGRAETLMAMDDDGVEPADVYNLTVEGYHTYFVGTAGVWVHNDKKSGLDPGGDSGVILS